MAGIMNVPISDNLPPPQPSPFVCSADSTQLFPQEYIQPTAAYTNNINTKSNFHQHKQQQHTNQNKSTMHHSNQTKPTQPKCRLCNNQHPNPWHMTDACPFKDPTYIQNRLIRKNVMQHNALFGRINKNYTKDMDIMINNKTPIKATLPRTAKTAIDNSNTPTTVIQNNLLDIMNHPQYHDIPDLDHLNLPTLDDHTTPDQTTLQIIPEPFINSGITSHKEPNTTTLTNETFHDDTDFLFDPNQYEYFAS
jgi:hypothetical protein